MELPVLSFTSPLEWEIWLKDNHTRTEGFWMRIFKKASGISSVTYAEALDVALCYGWIDGQKKTYDGDSWLQKFTPRRPRSVWSKVNTQHVERLIREGRMTAAGLKQVEAAKADGRWDNAYHSPSAMTVPDDFLAALEQNEAAKACFTTLKKQHRYGIAYRLQSAKRPETRQKRMKEFLEKLSKNIPPF